VEVVVPPKMAYLKVVKVMVIAGQELAEAAVVN
jgi:hypothetical protein